MRRNSLKKIACSVLIFTSLAQQSTGVLAEVTKTPKSGKITEESTFVTEDITLPKDYPSEINTYFDENVTARSFVVMDVETHRILAERDSSSVYQIASMSKIASIYLVYKAIDEGKLSLDTKIKAPDKIVENISSNYELSNVGLTADTEYSVKDLMFGMMLPSGNDATSTLLWEIYGNEELAVQAVIAQLKEWGITNVEFYQTSGIPNQYIPDSMWIPGSDESSENKLSAVDMALVADHLVKDYPEVLDITKLPEYTFMEGTPQQQVFINYNLLLPGKDLGREGVTGLKSGYTASAGKNMTTTTTENGRKLIVVVMGVFDANISTYQETQTILDKLNEYPELYKNENLPVAEKNVPTELDIPENLDNESTVENTDASKSNDPKNKRDNALTNFADSIFGIFNK